MFFGHRKDNDLPFGVNAIVYVVTPPENSAYVDPAKLAPIVDEIQKNKISARFKTEAGLPVKCPDGDYRLEVRGWRSIGKAQPLLMDKGFDVRLELI